MLREMTVFLFIVGILTVCTESINSSVLLQHVCNLRLFPYKDLHPEKLTPHPSATHNKYLVLLSRVIVPSIRATNLRFSVYVSDIYELYVVSSSPSCPSQSSNHAYWIQIIMNNCLEIKLPLYGTAFLGLLETRDDASVISGLHWISAWTFQPATTDLQGVGRHAYRY